MIDPTRWTQRLVLAVDAILPVGLAPALLWPDESSTEREISITPPLPKNIPTNGCTMGEPAAPVRVIEWGDYQCPYCRAFTSEVQPELVNEYVANGKICFEYRDFAFLGPESVLAAEAAACAMDQGHFWQYHDSLFANQGAENSGAFSTARLVEIAAQMGLDTSQFSQCLSSGWHRDEVLALRHDGIAHGIHGTPSFIVNGQTIVYRGWDSLQRVIESALAAS